MEFFTGLADPKDLVGLLTGDSPFIAFLLDQLSEDPAARSSASDVHSSFQFLRLDYGQADSEAYIHFA